MKNYIVKFKSATAADGFSIVDIPFATSVEPSSGYPLIDYIQNLVCNITGKHLENDNGIVIICPQDSGSGSGSGSGNGSGSEIISETVSESGSGSGSGSGNGSGSEIGTETGSGSGNGSGSETGSETGTETGSGSGSGSGSEYGGEYGSGSGSGSGNSLEPIYDKYDSVDVPQNELWYTSTDKKIVEPNVNDNGSGSGSGSGSGNAPVLPYISSNTYDVKNNIGVITFDTELTEIGDFAFQYSNLESIIIPDSVTSIGEYAFSNCNSLNSIVIPKNITNLSYKVFSDSNNLNNIKVSTDNTKYDSRNDCNAIIETNTNTLIIGCNNTVIPNNVTSIGERAFNNCDSLNNVVIPNSVTSIGSYAFNDCDSLNNVVIPNSVTSIGERAFYDCGLLTNITIPNSVTSIGASAFYSGNYGMDLVIYSGNATGSPWGAKFVCAAIENNLAYADIEKTEIKKCMNKSISTVTIPNTVTTIDSNAFDGCTGLTYIEIPSSVTTIGSNAFKDIPVVYYTGNATGSPWGAGLVCAIIENGLAYSNLEQTNLVKCVDKTLTSITIPNTVTTISENTFKACTKLTSVSIPNTVTTIGSNAFDGCTGLTYIEIPSSVTTIGSNAFKDIPVVYYTGNATGSPWGAGLVCVIIENGLGYSDLEKTNLVKCVDKSLNTITIPNTVTNIDSNAFSGCTGLTSISIPSSVTTIGSSAFSGCTGLTSISIPSSVTTIGSSAFNRCTGLTYIEIPNSITTIDDGCFYGCSSLETVVLSENVTNIESNAFGNCTSLKNINLEHVKKIHSYAFYKCTSLTSITFTNINTLEGYAFEDCTSLSSVTYTGAKDNWKYVTKYWYWHKDTKVTVVHCTNGDANPMSLWNNNL